MLYVLLVVNWRNMQHSKSTRNHLVKLSASRDVKMLTWLLNHGAKVSRQTIKQAALRGTPVSTMALLVEKGGVAALKDSCALQLAAGCDERDMVEFLLQVGADVEEMPAQLGDICEPGSFYSTVEGCAGIARGDCKVLLGTWCDGGYALWVAYVAEGDTTADGKTTEQQSNSKSS